MQCYMLDHNNKITTKVWQVMKINENYFTHVVVYRFSKVNNNWLNVTRALVKWVVLGVSPFKESLNGTAIIQG